LPAASAFGLFSSTSVMANGLLVLLNDCGVAIVGAVVFGVVLLVSVVFGVVMLGGEMVGSVEKVRSSLESE
jgi:hypothetical protein